MKASDLKMAMKNRRKTHCDMKGRNKNSHQPRAARVPAPALAARRSGFPPPAALPQPSTSPTPPARRTVPPRGPPEPGTSPSGAPDQRAPTASPEPRTTPETSPLGIPRAPRANTVPGRLFFNLSCFYHGQPSFLSRFICRIAF